MMAYGRVQEVANETWRSVLELYLPNSCILGTRVLGDVLEALGVKRFKPMALTAVMMNPAAAKHARSHACLFDGYDCLARTPNAKVVVLGGKDEMFRRAGQELWHGHLGAIVEGRYLVDISASQGNSPDEGLVIDRPLVFFVPRRFGHGGVWAAEDWLYGARLHYKAQPDYRTWETDFDWSAATNVRQALRDATLARLRGEPYEYPHTIQVIHRITGRR